MTPNSIHPTAILDEPFRPYQAGKSPADIVYRPTSYGINISIGAGAVIGKGVILEDGVVIDHQCIIEPNATIGRDSLLIYRAVVGGDAVIGADCVIGGMVAERCIIGSHCRVFGQLVHRHTNLSEPWDEQSVPEPSAVVGDHSFIGFGAVVVGGVTIGPHAYVCAGALITRDVPSGYIASGVNGRIRAPDWESRWPTDPLSSK